MADHGNVHVITSVQEWETKLEEGEKEKKVIVVDFTAVWCGPCRHMAPIFAELSKKHTDLIYLKVDVDQLQAIAAQWDVQAMPTFIFIKDKKLVHKIVGANKDELEKKFADGKGSVGLDYSITPTFMEEAEEVGVTVPVTASY